MWFDLIHLHQGCYLRSFSANRVVNLSFSQIMWLGLSHSEQSSQLNLFSKSQVTWLRKAFASKQGLLDRRLNVFTITRMKGPHVHMVTLRGQP